MRPAELFFDVETDVTWVAAGESRPWELLINLASFGQTDLSSLVGGLVDWSHNSPELTTASVYNVLGIYNLHLCRWRLGWPGKQLTTSNIYLFITSANGTKWAICDFQGGDGLRARKSDNRWGAGTARRLKRDKVVKIARLSSCKNFVSEREKFIFDAFVYLYPVEIWEWEWYEWI